MKPRFDTLRQLLRPSLGHAAAGACVWALAACGGGGDAPSEPPPDAAALAGTAAPARATPTTARATAMPEVRYAGGRLSLQVHERPLRQVLAAIQDHAGVAIAVAPELALRPVSAHIDSLPLSEALLSLLHDFDVVASYTSGADHRSVLQAVWVHARGAGPTAHPARVPGQPMLVAGDRAACDEPAERWSADQVDAALRGPDATQRYRALARSIELGMALPVATLLPLASSGVHAPLRLLALDLLAQREDDATLRALLQAARYDPEPTVQKRALELTEQLDRAAQRDDVAMTLQPPT